MEQSRGQVKKSVDLESSCKCLAVVTWLPLAVACLSTYLKIGPKYLIASGEEGLPAGTTDMLLIDLLKIRLQKAQFWND